MPGAGRLLRDDTDPGGRRRDRLDDDLLGKPVCVGHRARVRLVLDLDIALIEAHLHAPGFQHGGKQGVGEMGQVANRHGQTSLG